MKTRTTTIILAAAAVLLFSPLAEAKNLRQRLMSGEVMVTSVRQSGGVKAGRSLSIFHAPPALVYKVLTQVQQYHHFVPRMVESYKVSRGLYHLKTDLPWPVEDAWVRLKVKKGKRGNTYVITWTMESGTFKKFKGTAWIQPVNKGRSSMVTYQFLGVPKTIAPKVLLSKGNKVITEDVTFAMRDRTDDIMAGRVTLGKKVAKK